MRGIAQRTHTLCVNVPIGNDLPKPGGEIPVTSPMTGMAYAVHVTSIARLEWAKDGESLDVWVRGRKVRSA